MVLVLGGHDPADRLTLIAGLAEEPPGLLLVLLVVERRSGLRVPGLLYEEETRVQPEEVPVPHGGEHGGLHVHRRLHGLAQARVRHDPLLEIEDQVAQPYGLAMTGSTPDMARAGRTGPA